MARLRSIVRAAGAAVVFGLLGLVAPLGSTTHAAEPVEPLMLEHPLGKSGPVRATYSTRSLSLAIEVDRHQASLVRYTVKRRPFRRLEQVGNPKTVDPEESQQLEVTLLGPDGRVLSERVDLAALCLAHDPEAEPHVAGDTIRLHRDLLIVQLPELRDFDRVEVAYERKTGGRVERKSIGTLKMDAATFDPAGSNESYSKLAFADPKSAAPPKLGGGSPSVLWPENYDDEEIYRVWGNADEADRRINITIVPDGYTYEQKPLMEEHAAELVFAFRARPPYREHDGLINYTLVYAYSPASGTDQCDCGLSVASAMGTRFPDAVDVCGSAGNRCLYYGGGCDQDLSINIVSAELRAPQHDTTIVMVNTNRYGGCGGTRAVYSAGSSSGTEIAIHELGHSIAGLADEYAGNSGCGSHAGGVNTSTDPTVGAWPEWIDTLGAPREGAQYFNQCIYRPTDNCAMRSLFQQFCPVCKQRWALVFYGHPRVAPTAPIESIRPGAELEAVVDVPLDLAVQTRMPELETAEHGIEWEVAAPDSDWLPLARNTDAVKVRFEKPGLHRVRVTAVADKHLIRPERYGANVDTALFEVQVVEPLTPPEISPLGAEPLHFPDTTVLSWEDDGGAVTYNLYRGTLDGLATGNYGQCWATGLATNIAAVLDEPPPGTGWTFLVSGVNPMGEGPLGYDSSMDTRDGGTCAK